MPRFVTNTAIAVLPLVFILLVVGMVLVMHAVLYDCRLDRWGITIKWGGLPGALTIPYEDVVRVDRISSFAGMFSFALWAVNRPLGPKVLIERQSRWLPYVLVSPHDAEEFIATVRERMAATRGLADRRGAT